MKHTLKKSLALFLAVLMVVLCAPAAFAESGTDGGINWTVSGFTLTIEKVGFTHDTMKDYQGSEAPWQQYAQGVTKITIGAGVTKIGNDAFTLLSNVSQVTIPDTVTSIGGGAFRGCAELQSITIPNGVTTIRNSTFKYCGKLQTVTLPLGLTEIEQEAFYACNAQLTVNYPGGPDDWNKIEFGEDAFAMDEDGDPRARTEAEAVKINYYYGTGVQGVINAIDAIGTVEYSEACLNRIRAAMNAYDRLSATEQEKVTNYNVLYKAQTDYTHLENDASWLEEGGKCGPNVTYAFDKATCTLTISGTGPMYDYGSNSNPPFQLYVSVIKSVVIEEGVTTIGNSTFEGCQNMQSVTIPQGVTSIGVDAFCGCSGLTDVTIPKGVTSIGEEAFYGCSGLWDVTIPKSVTQVDYFAFAMCHALVTVNFTGSRKEWEAISFDSSEDYVFFGTSDHRTVNFNFRMNGVVTLHPGNGEADDRVNALVYEDMPQITLPEKEGAAFLGYFDALDGGKQYYNADGTSARTLDKAALDLYGHWINVYPVTFKSWDGKTVLKEETVAEGSDAAPPEIPARDPDETNHYTPGQWTGHTNITAATTLNAPYTAEAHAYGDTGDARFTCGTCGYVNETLKAQAEADDAAAAAAAAAAADKAAADAVEAKIAAIGKVEYTDASKAKIDDAKKAYDALTAAQKQLVENKGVLDAAAKKYAELKAEAEKPTEPDKPTDPTEPEIEPSDDKLLVLIQFVVEMVKFLLLQVIPFIISVTK